jgi:hypothetical protein
MSLLEPWTGLQDQMLYKVQLTSVISICVTNLGYRNKDELRLLSLFAPKGGDGSEYPAGNGLAPDCHYIVSPSLVSHVYSRHFALPYLRSHQYCLLSQIFGTQLEPLPEPGP